MLPQSCQTAIVTRRLARLLVLLPFPACGANCDDDLPAEAELCVEDVDCEGAANVALEIGDGNGPWDEGETVDAVQGPQGGFMILPTLCLAVPDTSEACLLVTLDNTFDGTDPDADAGPEEPDEDGVHARYRFHRDGDRLCAGPLYDFLTYSRTDLGLGGVTVDAEVCGAAGSGVLRRRVALAPPP